MRVTASIAALLLLLALFCFPSIGAAKPAGTPPPHEDALVAPPPTGITLESLDDGRGPSQYMASDVAVLLVLPESTGAREPSSEDWTPASIEAVRVEVQRGLDWWAERLPMAHLRFQVQLEVVPTIYEPTRHGLDEEGLWIGDTLRQLGYREASYFDQAYSAAAGVRDALGADWGTVIFVPNSANGDGSLADGRFAYAYINGPLLVITSDAGGYGTDDLSAVLAHELGHTFGALDQYAAAHVACDRSSGYLNTPTTNSQYSGCGTQLPSIMLDAHGAFNAGIIDASALHQVGYRDSDGDGLIDPLDTAPALELQPHSLAAATGRPLLRGSAHDLAFPSEFLTPVTLNTIAAVEYRVNGGLWLPTAATDGAFDSAREEFDAELPLYDGSYSVEVRAVNSVGATSAVITRSLEITWVGPAPSYSLSAPATTQSAAVNLELVAPASTVAMQVSERPSFAGAAWQPYTPSLTHTLTAGDGPRSLYVRFQDQFGLSSLPLRAAMVLDTLPPQGAASRKPAAPDRLLLSAADSSTAVTAVEVTIDGAAPRWLPYADSIELPEATADHSVSVRFRDEAGNVSPSTPAAFGYTVALPLVRR